MAIQNEVLDDLRQRIRQRDYARAATLLAEPGGSSLPPSAKALLFTLVAAQVSELPAAVRLEKVKRFLDEVTRDTADLTPESGLALADLYLVAGLRHEAGELCYQLLERQPLLTAAAHRLGLCELSRAATSPLRNARVVGQRWRRALAYLTAAVADQNYTFDWVRGRLEVYAREPEEGAWDQAQRRVVQRLRDLVLQQAQKAEREKCQESADALKCLAVDLDMDQAATDAFRAAIEALPNEPRSNVPYPFGRLWLDTMTAQTSARQFLAEVIRQTSLLPRDDDAASADPFAPTHGLNVRQWFSRLAPIRHALRWGQLEAAQTALHNICGKEEGCRVNEHPALMPLAGSPKCCDPACPSFASCNAGYVGFSNPAREMEEDAHRLAIRTYLSLAEQHAMGVPPRFLESAQYWVRARTLARSIDATQQLEEDVAAQVMALLEHYRKAPEYAAELLERAMAAVPGPSIQGRFADRLMDRGIERCNEDRWAEGVYDLRWALRLNPYSERAHRNLGTALQNLALFYLDANNVRQAYATAKELNELAEAAVRGNRQKDAFEPLLEWSAAQLRDWQAFHDRQDDPRLNTMMNDFLQRFGN